MIDLWTSFAVSGNPKSNELLWSEVSAFDNEPKVMNIMTEADDSAIIAMPEYGRLKVWNEIYRDAQKDLV